MSIPAVNGHAPATGADLTAPIEEIDGELMPQSNPRELSIDRIEDDLTALLAPIRDERAELEVRVLELSTQEDRITAAIRALGGVNGGVKPKPVSAKPASKKGPSSPGAIRHKPSDEALTKVLAKVRTLREPKTVPQIAELMKSEGISATVVGKAVAYLRETEQIRMAGIRPGKGFAPMYLAMES